MGTLVTNPFQGVLYWNYERWGKCEKFHLPDTSISAAALNFLEVVKARSYLLAEGARLVFAVVRQVKRPAPLLAILPTPIDALRTPADDPYWLPPNDVFTGPWLCGETADGLSNKKLLHCLADDELIGGHWIREGFTMPAGPAVAPPVPGLATKQQLVDYYLLTLRERTRHASFVGIDGAGNTTWTHTPWSAFFNLGLGKEDPGRRWAPVSWEPGDYNFGPVFSPCGCRTMVVRSCYDAPCKFYSNGIENEIRHYFVSESAELLPFPNIFYPAAEFLGYTRGAAPGEKTPHRKSWWRAGFSWSSAPGVAPTGTAADFLGLTSASYNQSLPTPVGLLPECDAMTPTITVRGSMGAVIVVNCNLLTIDEDTMTIVAPSTPPGTNHAYIGVRPAPTPQQLANMFAIAGLAR